MRVRALNSLNYPRSFCDVNLLPFGLTGEINFKKQLDGSAKELVDLGRLSSACGGLTVLGAVSDNYGVKRRSAFVFEKGRLCSICDMNVCEEGFSPSLGYKIFNAGGRKIGILADRDVYSPQAVQALALCGCDAIINLYAGFSGRKAEIAAEFFAYLYGVNFVFLSENSFMAFNPDGEPISLNADGEIELPEVKKAHETRVKRRGLANF